MPELTVIMPVYNGDLFLKEAIDSVLNQTFSDFKLLVLNDNSQDGTSKILEAYQQKDARIEVVTKMQNVGPATLRNEGITLAETEFIALMDADDIALSARFEKQINFLKNNPDHGVCGTWFTFFGDKKNKVVKHEASHEQLKIQMLSNCCIGNPTVMFKKSHLGDLRFENEFVPAEDYRLWSQLITRTKFHNLQESLLRYRWHPNNISQTKAENLKRSEIVIKKQQLSNLGIALDDPNIDYYLNAVNVKKGLSESNIIKTIEASIRIKEVNNSSGFYNLELFENHVNKVVIRTIRNCKDNSKSYYNYIKNESGYFSMLPKLDAIVLYLKCLF